eukprot:6290063-Pyramimonas_sp.AAC.1
MPWSFSERLNGDHGAARLRVALFVASMSLKGEAPLGGAARARRSRSAARLSLKMFCSAAQASAKAE